MEPFSSSSSSPHNPADVEALRRLSDSLLLLLLLSPSDSFSDLTIAVRSSDPPRDLAVHRCILSARSPFFRRLLPGATERLDLGEILPCFDVGFDALVLVVGYLYSGKVGPLPRGGLRVRRRGLPPRGLPPGGGVHGACALRRLRLRDLRARQPLPGVDYHWIFRRRSKCQCRWFQCLPSESSHIAYEKSFYTTTFLASTLA